MNHAIRALGLTLLGLLVAATAALGAADDILKTYKKRYSPEKSFFSAREDVLNELAETGSPKAMPALLWCLDASRDVIAEKRKDSVKLLRELEPVRDAYIKKLNKYMEQFRKQGKPEPKRHPAWPVRLELDKLTAEKNFLEKQITEERELIESALAAHGKLVAELPAEDQVDLRAEWEKGPLAAKDWFTRASQWELVGGVPTAWSLEMLLTASSSEPDPRVLVIVIDGLSGRDPARVLPALQMILDDVRWTVRVAALAALERIETKEAVDLIVAVFEREEGRLQDDCARALRTLTGEDFGLNLVQWKSWWMANRADWKGPPKPEPEEGEAVGPVKHDENEAAKDPSEREQEEDERSTGFFGIDTRSKRLVYVIDVSGSMNEKAAEKAVPTRADRAKEELKRAVLALEDGAVFNIVFFAADVRLWKKEMVEAAPETRLAAVEFIDKTPVVGGTATYDALKAAFDLGDVGRGKKRGADPSGDAQVDTIILLSDGKPSVGSITNPDQIRAAVVEWHVSRRIAVHTVAFGADADRTFMEGLATDTGGAFVAK